MVREQINPSFAGFDGASHQFLVERGKLRSNSDRIAARELKILWARSHDLCRNNPSVVTAHNRITAGLVGDTGVRVRWNNPLVQDAWEVFADDPNLNGVGTLLQTQTAWARAIFESGECFTRMLISKEGKGKIPLKLQTLEAEQLDPTFFSYGTKVGNIRNAIEFYVKSDKPKSYHFWENHPDTQFVGNYNRVPVKAQEVLHLMETSRIGQWRGIPKTASSMLVLYQLEELLEAALVKQKVGMAMGWAVTVPLGADLPNIGKVEVTGDGDDPDVVQRITSGGIHYFNSGEQVQEFKGSDGLGTGLVALLKAHWRSVAGSFDLTYEQLTGDLTETDFSSIRAGSIEYRRRIKHIQQTVLVGRGLLPLTRKFADLCSIYLNVSLKKLQVEFVAPAHEWLDPLKGSQTDEIDLRAGFKTMEKLLTERGVVNVAAHLAQLEKEREMREAMTSQPLDESSTQENKSV